MKITPVSKQKDVITFSVSDVGVAYMNALRRSVIDYVPTLAIEDVHFSKNSSVLYDEVLAHRLGLLPILTEVGTYSWRVEGESSLGSELHFTLDVKGPQTVYADQLQSKDPKAVCAHAKTPVVLLLKDQEVKCEAIAVLGIGKDHAKWSPGTMYYSYDAHITVNNKAKDLQTYIERFPSKVVDNGKISKELIVKHGLVDACEDIYPEAVSVTYDSKVLHVTVESWGQLEAPVMVQQGCAYIQKALQDLLDTVTSLK
ncbi:MAG: DNA-directed RNA polymerase subunit D [Candidatus Woesearchaeota archaeon]